MKRRINEREREKNCLLGFIQTVIHRISLIEVHSVTSSSSNTNASSLDWRNIVYLKKRRKDAT